MEITRVRTSKIGFVDMYGFKNQKFLKHVLKQHIQ